MAIIEGMVYTRRIEALEEQARMLLQAVEDNRRRLKDVSAEKKRCISREALTEALQSVMVGWEARLEGSLRAQEEKFVRMFSCQDETEKMKAVLEKRVCWEDFTLGLQKLKENCLLAHEQTTADSAMNLHKAHLQRQLDKKAQCLEFEEVQKRLMNIDSVLNDTLLQQNHNINILRNDLSEQIYNNWKHFQHSMAQIKSTCRIIWNKFGLHDTGDNDITDDCFSTSHTTELVTSSPALALDDSPSSPASNVLAICDTSSNIATTTPQSDTTLTTKLHKSLLHVLDTSRSAAATTPHSNITLTTKLDKSLLHVLDTSRSAAATTPQSDTTLTTKLDKSLLHVLDTSGSAAATTPQSDTTLTTKLDKSLLHVLDTSRSAAATTPHSNITLTTKLDKSPLHVSNTSSSAAATTPQSNTTLTTNLMSRKFEDQSCASHQAVDCKTFSSLSESPPYHKHHRLKSDAILPRSVIER